MTIKLTKANILTVIELAILAFFALCFLTGCAKVRVTRSDGTEIEYTRWGNQTVESFLMEADGSVLFEKQKSEHDELYKALNTAIGKIP